MNESIIDPITVAPNESTNGGADERIRQWGERINESPTTQSANQA